MSEKGRKTTEGRKKGIRQRESRHKKEEMMKECMNVIMSRYE